MTLLDELTKARRQPMLLKAAWQQVPCPDCAVAAVFRTMENRAAFRVYRRVAHDRRVSRG